MKNKKQLNMTPKLPSPRLLEHGDKRAFGGIEYEYDSGLHRTGTQSWESCERGVKEGDLRYIDGAVHYAWHVYIPIYAWFRPKSVISWRKA